MDMDRDMEMHMDIETCVTKLCWLFAISPRARGRCGEAGWGSPLQMQFQAAQSVHQAVVAGGRLTNSIHAPCKQEY
jgi:hypothetical protein